MPAMNYSQIAKLYDSYVKVDLDIPFFINEAQKRNGKILELMSGTGRVSIPLIKSGNNLTCVDSSAEMLQILQDKLNKLQLTADVVEADVANLNLGEQFNFIFIPFHSFSELVKKEDQQMALAKMNKHLTYEGVIVVTLHNPKVRLKSEDGLLRLLGKFPIENTNHTLFLWGQGLYNQELNFVEGHQFYEEYDASGTMISKKYIETKFCVLNKSDFELLALNAGLKTTALYGDYSYGKFDEAMSPFMIFFLQKL